MPVRPAVCVIDGGGWLYVFACTISSWLGRLQLLDAVAPILENAIALDFLERDVDVNGMNKAFM